MFPDESGSCCSPLWSFGALCCSISAQRHKVAQFCCFSPLSPPLLLGKTIPLQSEGLKPDDFTWEAFQKFLDSLCLRPEIQSIFEERLSFSRFHSFPVLSGRSKSRPPFLLLCSGSKRKLFISLDQFMEFINRRQRDSRLNEVLYPPLKRDQVRQIMEKYETNTSQLERGSLLLHPPTPPFHMFEEKKL